jgi:hypothetical protein
MGRHASAHLPFSAWPNSLAPVISSLQGREAQEGGAPFQKVVIYIAHILEDRDHRVKQEGHRRE